MHRAFFVCAAGAVALVVYISTPEKATPFSLEYNITDLGADGYRYDFELILDNNDGSFILGQQFDFFTFGNQSGAEGSDGAFGSWSWLTIPTDFTVSSVSGARNGPALIYGTGTGLPGYSPTTIGQVLAFSGKGQNFLGQGQLLWSNLWWSDGAVGANFETALLAPTPVPLPGALVLFGTALAGLFGFQRFRRRGDHAGTSAAR